MFTQSENALLTKDLCFLDIETTGSVVGFHEIVDVAALRTTPDAMKILGIWHKRIRPNLPNRITIVAQELNRFTLPSWENAEASTASLWKDFVAFTQGSIPVCHNPSFERAFITLAAVEQGVRELGLDYHWIGTESIAWPMYKRGHLPGLSLEALSMFFGAGVEPHPHTAMGGVYACWRVYKALMNHELVDQSIGREFRL